MSIAIQQKKNVLSEGGEQLPSLDHPPSTWTPV